MATFNLTTTPTQIDDGTSYMVQVTNTGGSQVILSRGGTLWPGQLAEVYPEGTALTAATATSIGSVSTSTTSAPLPNAADPAALAANAAFTGKYARLLTTDATSTSASGTLIAWHLTPVDATAAPATWTLPAANSVTAGGETAIKKADASANTVTVTRAGSDLIFGTGSGSTSKTLTLAGEAVTLISNGVDRWTIQTSDTPSGVLASTYLTQASATSTYADFRHAKIRAAAARAAARNTLLLGPMTTPPTLTTASTTQSTGLGLTASVRAASSAANLARYRVVGGVGQVYSTSYYTAWSYTMADGTNGNTVGDATHQSYQIAFEWVSDAAWFQIQQLARTAGFMLYVDDQPVSAGVLATSVNYGGTCFTLVDWSVGSATITASTGVFTTSSAHGLGVGDVVYLGAITTTTGVSANTPYFVLTTPSSTTFTLSATIGGTALSLTSDGSTARVAKSTSRKYRLEFFAGAFLQLDLSPMASLYPPQEDTLRVCTVGDSVDSMTGATYPAGGWQHYAGKLLGWTDVRAVSFGGTGFTTAAAHANTFGAAQRVADVVIHNPDLLVIQASQNDDVNNASLQAAALAALQAYRAALPLVPIVVVGVDASSSGPSAGRQATETTTKAAFDQWADGNSYWIPNTNDTAGSWFTGTGYAASRASSGNRDMYGSDASHPNDAGHRYLGTRFAQSFRRLVLPTLR